ncbi:MAG TPA: hypothetical protein VKB24_09945 [Candidatus Acidoferrum sp.]|nr:hypothetical protein [Candidatus Acidoferrum sp.]
MEKPIKGINRLEEVEDEERAARLFRLILEAAEERRALKKQREAKANAPERSTSTGGDG